MTDEKFERALREMARDYHAPPQTPREEIWARIQAQRTAVRTYRRTAGRGVVWWVVAAAATLAVGVGIGRYTAVRDGGTGPVPAVASEDDGALGTVPVAYRVAAAEHLARVEVFLAGFRADVRTGRSPEVTPAQELLTTTRLLQQSPAAEHPALGGLLDDVELVLVQIALLRETENGTEVDLITDGMERRDVLLKLRSAATDAAATAVLQGA